MKFKKPKIKRHPLSKSNQTDREVMLSHFDPNGSYTGLPVSDVEGIKPVQDADDL